MEQRNYQHFPGKGRHVQSLTKMSSRQNTRFDDCKKSTSPAANMAAANMFKQFLDQWYPDLHEKTYFLPPIHFSRVPFGIEDVASTRVLISKGSSSPSTSAEVKTSEATSAVQPQSGCTIPDNKEREDNAQARILHCIRAIADLSKPREVMMVLSQLEFGKYMNKPCYAAAASSFPSQKDLQHKYRLGDFDILIIHRDHGLIVGECKSVGADFGSPPTEESSRESILRKLKHGLKQLQKAEVVLGHLVKDLDTVQITKTFMLPNITSTQLLQSVASDHSLSEELCKCLCGTNINEAVNKCLCAENVPQIDTQLKTSDEAMIKLQDWWRKLLCANGHQQTMKSCLYIELVARFCGPATTVDIHTLSGARLELRTLGDGVSEVGERTSRFVLTPEQLELLHTSPPRVFLLGPPGTGKTVVLVLQAMCWLQKGHNVHVLSTWNKSKAASLAIEQQLLKAPKSWFDAAPSEGKRIRRHESDFRKEVDSAVSKFKAIANSQHPLCVIADEAGPDYGSRNFTKFCDELIKNVPDVCIWGAAMQTLVWPQCLKKAIFLTPLRSPPVVVRAIEEAPEITKMSHIQHYHRTTLAESEDARDSRVVQSEESEGSATRKEPECAQPYDRSIKVAETDGPPVLKITHCGGQSGHSDRPPDECQQCGKEVAHFLRHLGLTDVRIPVPGAENQDNQPPPLHYRDVFVLCDNVRDEKIGRNGRMVSQAIGLVRGLRSTGVPVRVVDSQASDDTVRVRDTVLAARDEVTVTTMDHVRGLERKVIVTGPALSVHANLHGASRCSSQLIWISSSED